MEEGNKRPRGPTAHELLKDDANDDPFGPSRRPRVRFGAIGEGWELFKAQWLTWIVAGLIVMLGNSMLIGAVHSIFHLKLPKGKGGGGFLVLSAAGRVIWSPRRS